MSTINLTDDAKRSIIFNEFVLALQIEPGRALSGGISRILEKAWRQEQDGIELLYEALKMLKEPAKLNLKGIATKEQETSMSSCLTCGLCGKQFEKGIKAWSGNKRFCTQKCTIENLRAA